MERLAFTCRIGGRPTSGDASPAVREHIAASATTPDRNRAAYVSLLAFLAILLFRPQDDIPGLELLHLADIFGTLAVITLVVDRLGRGLGPTRMTPEVGGVLAFAAVMVGTVPLSTWPGGSFAVFTDLFVKVVIILILMINTLTSPERIGRVITIFAVGAVYVGSRAVVDYVRGVNMLREGRLEGALNGLFGNANDMAANLATFLPFVVALGLRRDYRVFRLVALGGVPLIVAAIIFSQSRAGTLGLLAMLAVLLYQTGRLRPAVAVVVLAAGLTAVPFLPESFTERMASIVDAEKDPTGSREARKTLMREALATFVAHPFTGVGAGQFENYGTDGQNPSWRQTHNAPLQVAAELGIAGLSIYLFLIWTVFSACLTALRNARAMRRANRREDRADWLELNAAMLLAAVTGWFVSAMFASVAYYWTLYLLLGLTGSIRDVSERLAGGAALGRRPARSREAA
jgi:O-antigen ligase